MWPILLAVLLIVVLLVLIRCIVIVPQSNDYVVEWLGVYKETWSAGLHLKVPFLERVARRVSLKEEVADFPPQPVITRDNVTMMIDTVVFFQVFDAKAYAYGVNRPIQAIENLSATTLRDIIGSMSLDETLTSRDLINTKITATLDEATDRWGIKVNRIELKNIEPPAEIRQAMEKQMKKAGRHHPRRRREGKRDPARRGCQGTEDPRSRRPGPGPAACAEGPGRLCPHAQRSCPHAEHARLAQHGSDGEGGRRQGDQDHRAQRYAEHGRHGQRHQGPGRGYARRQVTQLLPNTKTAPAPLAASRGRALCHVFYGAGRGPYSRYGAKRCRSSILTVAS